MGCREASEDGRDGFAGPAPCGVEIDYEEGGGGFEGVELGEGFYFEHRGGWLCLWVLIEWDLFCGLLRGLVWFVARCVDLLSLCFEYGLG